MQLNFNKTNAVKNKLFPITYVHFLSNRGNHVHILVHCCSELKQLLTWDVAKRQPVLVFCVSGKIKDKAL